MKFSCLSTELSVALLNTSKATAGRSPLAVTEGVLLEALEDKICIIGYNFEIAITTFIPAKVEENGKIVLCARLFTEIIKHIPDGVIDVKSDANLHFKITCNNMMFDIVGMESQDYPQLPEVATTDTIVVNAEKFKDVVNKTIYAASTDESKLIYTGALINFKKNKMSMVALDGFRMAIKETEIKSSFKTEKSVVCPTRALQEVTRLIVDSEKDVLIDVADSHIMFRVNNYTIISKLLEGKFLDYEATITKQFSTKVTVKTQELIKSVERTAVMALNKLKALVVFKIENNKICMSCVNTTGTANDELICNVTGEPITISFNSRFLLEALHASNCEEVSLQFSGNLAPSIIKSAKEETDFLFLVLPIRNPNVDNNTDEKEI